MELPEIIKMRRSVKSYDAEKSISDAELKSLFEEVTLSPSSFNLQHWVFIAVRDPVKKKQLREAVWGQEQVESCSIVLLICGKSNAHQDAPKIYAEAPQEIQDKVLPLIHDFYDGNPQRQRDEALRSASLAAMTLMFAAQNKGWVTCPMIGFDPAAVSGLCQLTSDHIPVMMITLGYQKNEPRPRPCRRPVSEVVRWNSLNGSGLQG